MMSKPSRRAVSGQIRIIAGQWRGRKLPVADSTGLRPTTDRIRETLFNWLAPSLQQARCLDCFSGSGALALEALSRYAASATLLERERAIAQQLEKNIRLLGIHHARVINTDTLRFLDKPGEPYTIVFVDPPFRQGLVTPTLHLLETHHWLSEGALIYTESEVEYGLPTAPANWQLYREKIAGQAACRLWLRQHNSKENNHAA